MSNKNNHELEKIPFPHDAFFQKSLRQISIAKDFFEHSLPAHILNDQEFRT